MIRWLFKQVKTVESQLENISLKMGFRLVVLAFVVCSLYAVVQVSQPSTRLGYINNYIILYAM